MSHKRYPTVEIPPTYIGNWGRRSECSYTTDFAQAQWKYDQSLSNTLAHRQNFIPFI